jgi:hypothetical protein
VIETVFSDDSKDGEDWKNILAISLANRTAEDNTYLNAVAEHLCSTGRDEAGQLL